MVERKLYKTKLCLLYQKGRCHRQNCSFAHGNADLRRSFNGRRDYGGRDLREKLDRRRSPVRRYSPPRDGRGRHASHGEGSPWSLGRRNDLKHQKTQQFDGQSDISGSLRSPLGNEDQVFGQKQLSSDSRDVLDEQLTQVQSDIKILIDHKRQLELYVEERVKEADGLTSKVQELEMLFNKEKEECERITSKIKKFIKAYNRHSQLQDEVKKSYVQLDKLGEALGSDIAKTNGGNLNINFTSDEEPASNTGMKPRNEQKKNASSSRKRLRIDHQANEAPFKENSVQGEEIITKEIRSNKYQSHIFHGQSDRSKKAKAENNRKNELRPLTSEDKPRRERNSSADRPFGDKGKFIESNLILPSTSMAAHSVDEVVEIVEMDEKVESVGTVAAVAGSEMTVKGPLLPFPPPPPPPIIPNGYSQYKGNDERVDIDGVDEQTTDVDIV